MEQQKKISRRIKPIVLVSVITLLVIVTVLALLIYFWFHPKTRNVFDQLYYEVRAVEWRRDSVLISGTESAYAHYDLGTFHYIDIPELDMCIGIAGDTLWIHLDEGEYIQYEYHLKEKKLYGERPLDYLTDHFLNDYFSWWDNAGKSNPYSTEGLGEYEFEVQENV